MTTPRLLRIVIDHGDCVGSGMCEVVAPHAFALGDAGKAVVVGANPVLADADVVDAIEGCPMAAITAIEVATGEQVWP